MSCSRVRLALSLAVACGVLVSTTAHAQLGGLGRAARDRAAQAAAKAAAERLQKQKADSASAARRNSASAETARGDSAGARPRRVFANYDFVPGQRTLFFTDFSDEQVGNFPRRLQFKSGSMEVVEIDGKRALKASSQSGFVIPLSETLPARFTLEMDIINRNSQGVAAPTVKIYGGTEPKTDVDTENSRIYIGYHGYGVTGGGTTSEGQFNDAEVTGYVGQPLTLRVLGDGDYLKVYADGRRVTNVPNAKFLRGRGLYVSLEGRDEEENAAYITSIRVAESQKSVYEALEADGRWATQGILFETGKSVVQPESGPTLKAIADALTQNPSLRIRIEGHTDNVGNADANLRLSQARAEAVKAALVSQYRIDASRLETAGLGATKPVGDNRTAEGRSNNRRVEVVKL